MDYKTLFSKTPPTRLFFTAAIPGAIGMLASALYQLVDGIFVGQILGDVPFAAINLAMPFVIINFALADLIGLGSAVPISVKLGAKEEKAANNIFTCACILIVAVGFLFGAGIYFAAPYMIKAMGAEGDLFDMAVSYLRVYALCSPVTTIVFAVDNYLRICGKIRGSMILNIFMSVLSAVLEFIFLYVLKFDIWGAALATCTGMFVCALIALYPFFRGKMQLKFCRPKFSMRIIGQTIKCGSPNFLNNIAGRVTSIIMNAVLLRMGGENAVSVYGILMYVDGFVQPLLYGMCDSLQPAVGYNWGAGDIKRVKAIEKRCYFASAVLSVMSFGVIFAFPKQITGLFISNPSEGVLSMSVNALFLFSFTYITRWFSFATQSYMTAIEKSVQASVISVATALVFPLIVIVALWNMGIDGLWLNMTVTSVMAAILSAIILKSFMKKIKEKNIPFT